MVSRILRLDFTSHTANSTKAFKRLKHGGYFRSSNKGAIKQMSVTQFVLFVLLSLLCFGRASAQEETQKQVIKAICIPLADHYAGIIAYEKYANQMKHADYQIEMLPGPKFVRSRFREDDADMAFNVCPMILDMFAENPNFRWVSLIHRDGNALAINELLNAHVHLPVGRLDRKPDEKVAEAYSEAKEEQGKPTECAVPSHLATHTVILYKYLKDHGKTLAFDTREDPDVIVEEVSPPLAPIHIKKQNSRSIHASVEQSLPWVEVVETEGYGHIAWYSKDVMNWPKGHVECLIIAKNAAIEEKEDAVREVIYFIHKAGRDIENARRAGGQEMEDIVGMIRKHIPAHPREAIIQSLRPDINAINYYNLNVDDNAKDGLKQIMTLAVEGGILKQAVDIDALADSRFSTEITQEEVPHGSDAAPVLTPANSSISEDPQFAKSQTPVESEDVRTFRINWIVLLIAVMALAVISLGFWIIRGNLTFALRAGLPRTLLLWFLVLALLPLTIVSIVSYWNARRSLQENAIQTLEAVAELKTEHINSYFSRMVTDLEQQAENVHNVRFLTDLHAAFVASQRPPREFVKSFTWETLVQERGGDLAKYQKNYGYYDILLIDGDGNVLFSVARENDLGGNLFRGRYSNTHFAMACKKTLETGCSVFSDYERYTPFANSIAGFLVSALIDDHGEKVGVLAFEIPIDQIDEVMKQRSGLGRTGDGYLIGTDLRMRSNSALAKEQTILGDPIDTEQARLWLESHGDPEDPLECSREVAFGYIGYQGVPVLGTHKTIEVAGVRIGFIEEVEQSEAFAPAVRLKYLVFSLLGGTVLVVLLVALPLAGRIVRPVLTLSSGARRVADGDYESKIEVISRNEIGDLANSFNTMLCSLSESRAINETQAWLKTGQAGLNDSMRGDQGIEERCRNIITYMAKYLNVQIGALYVKEGDVLRLAGSYAYQKRKNLSNEFSLGEGLVGQAALEKSNILLTNVPVDYIRVCSGLGDAVPENILVMPFIYEGEVKGVIELGSLHRFTDKEQKFLELVQENIAIAMNGAQNRRMLAEALEQSQRQAEELQAQSEELQQQSEELQVANEELEEKSQVLEKEQAKLQAINEELEQKSSELEQQSEELQASNEELEGKSEVLESQNEDIERKNAEIEASRKSLEEKARELEIASKYKSEFLANMSHEIRTPLNSLLILAQTLAENDTGNLNEDQIKSAQVIHSSGLSLLTLINDILDLSKVEAGKLNIEISPVQICQIVETLQNQFRPVAEGRSLEFKIEISDDLTPTLDTDSQRLEQILRNLLSNAFKFTENGSVTMQVKRPGPEVSLNYTRLTHSSTIAFSVQDTGIGIPKDKQAAIFEAFQQADGSTSRKYGGTGLGLTIARELAKILGGELQLESEEGKGTIITLYLPLIHKPQQECETQPQPIRSHTTSSEMEAENLKSISTELNIPIPEPEYIPDDRHDITEDTKSILIIEDDPDFARILMNLSHKKGYKCIVTAGGKYGLEAIMGYTPNAVILDLGLPDIDGIQVLENIKRNVNTRHIPVHVISGRDDKALALRQGAVGYITKPVTTEQLEGAFSKINRVLDISIRKLLVIEDDLNTQKAIAELVKTEDIVITEAYSGSEGVRLIQSQAFDCVILDLKLGDMDGFELLQQLSHDENIFMLPPIVVYTCKELSKEEHKALCEHTQSVVIKGANSSERLLDEVSLFLHSVESSLPARQRKIINMLHNSDEDLLGRKILLVDDDIRNTFALSKVLSKHGLSVELADNGQLALDKLQSDPNYDLVLMDVMMPVMDGLEAMRRIRQEDRFKDLPVIALTAKAMPEDRVKCIEAGANDYLTKPIDTDKLISVMRIWLFKSKAKPNI